jgi:arylsulfatase A-like enzyme
MTPNIILLTLDSVRADHLGCYGYTSNTSPNIDKIAREGILFEHAFCQAPNTWVSHASLLTGCYPNRHGLRRPLDLLNPRVSTLPQILKVNGFVTGGFPAHGLVGSIRGFQRGFDLFDEEDMLHDSTILEGVRQGRDWDVTIEKACEWISDQNRPFFLWLHYMGTHWAPPETLSLPEDLQRKFSPLGQYHDAKISLADQICIGALNDFLKKERLIDKTILVVTADHGEEDLTKNDPPFRNRAHDNTINEWVTHVPLILHSPGLIPAGVRVPGIVRLIDLTPTLLEMCGISFEVMDFDGESLVSIWENKQEDDERWAYMENVVRKYAGVRTRNYKLILKVGPPQPSKKLIHRIIRRIKGIINRLFSRQETIPSTNEKFSNYKNWEIASTVGFYEMNQDYVEEINLHGEPGIWESESAMTDFVLRMFRTEPDFNPSLTQTEKNILTQRLIDLDYL